MADESNGRAPAAGKGKTVADVLDNILASPGKWFALLALLAGCSLLLVLLMFALSKLFGIEPAEIQIGASDSHVVLKHTDRRTGSEEAIVIVNPQGWQKTGIEVRPGNRLSLSANGKVCIDLNEIWEKVQLRRQYEDEWAKRYNIRRNDSSETRVPEDYFTDEQRKSLVLDRPWVGPDGFDLGRFQPSFRSRRSRYLLPMENAGGLVAAIRSDSGGTPARSDAFFVGRSREDYPVSQRGWLWFTVNDVQYNDPNNPNLFYNDNLGAFWVKVVKKRG
jgi:hypothetical protein